MSNKKIILFLVLIIIKIIHPENKVYYISPEGNSKNAGTKESPWNFDWDAISKKLRNAFTSSNKNDSYTIYFLEGDYYVNKYGISLTKMYQGQYIRFWAEPGARVRIIGGKKLPEFRKHEKNNRIWITEIGTINTSYTLIFNNRFYNLARSPKSWNYDRLWDYYTSPDPFSSSYINRHYVVSEELIKILSLLTLEELNQAKIICKHNYHTEKDYILSIDTTKNEIITNVTQSRENYIAALPIKKDALFYVENVYNFLTESNEYFILNNGTIFIYIEENDNIEDSEAFIVTSEWMGFHCNQDNGVLKGNFEVKDIEIYGTSNYGIYLSNTENVTIENVTIHQAGGGISIQACNNITIRHSYIYDVVKYGQYIAKSDNIISENNIIRYFQEGHGIEVADGNNTKVINNEVAAGYAAGIMVKSHSQYDMKTIRNILVKDNHVHHIGFGINNDIGAIQVLMETNGLIIEHNHFHDIWTESYAGHGLYLGSATAGAFCKNNLVHDTSISSFKIDLGCETTLENNIFAYEGNYILGWTTNKPEYHEFNIHKNIFLVTTGILMIGPWNNNDANMTINNNIYWHATKGKEGITFRWDNYEQWISRGYDIDSLIEDPMFTDHEKRDFTFKNNTNINKIGFVPFNLTFGVTGEEYWLELANGASNNNFHENQILPPSIIFTSGSTNFDIEEEKDSFLKNCTIKPSHSTIEISEEEKYSGKKSLKFAKASKASNSNSRPEISVPCNYEQGHGTFSFKFYVKNIKNKIQINFDSFLYITIYNGKISSSDFLFNYEENKWNELIINLDFGDAKTNSTFDIQLNDDKKTGEKLSYSTLSTFKIQMVETFNDTFIDDLTCKTDYEIPLYYRDTFNENANFMGTSTFESLFYKENSNNNDNSYQIEFSSKSNQSEKYEEENGNYNDLSKGAIVGICLGCIFFVLIAIWIAYFIYKNKNKQKKINSRQIYDENEFREKTKIDRVIEIQSSKQIARDYIYTRRRSIKNSNQ